MRVEIPAADVRNADAPGIRTGEWRVVFRAATRR
jgi:hypothetical protein